MTKDWDAVQDEICDLSITQKKPLEEIRAIMQRKHNFRASTRAYRMRLAEWGLTKHNRPPRKKRSRSGEKNDTTPIEDDEVADNSSTTAEPMSIDTTPAATSVSERESNWQVVPTPRLENAEPTTVDMLHQPSNLDLSFDPLSMARTLATTIVMDMLGAILDNDTTVLEKLLLEHVSHINDPIGLPFDLPNSRFYNHPIMQQMVILQHPDQTLLDVACGMPCGPIVWVLLSLGAKGSRHPLGTDLALHNAIKNGRVYTVQALLIPDRSQVNGLSTSTWKPLLQAVFWNHPEVVRVLIRKGARIDDAGPSPYGPGSFTPLQLCLDRRMRDYADTGISSKCNDTLKMLLNAGASVHAPPPGGTTLSPFEMFLKPMQAVPYWALHMSPVERECLGLFIKQGADPLVHFEDGARYPCSAESSRTLAHQVLWHSTPEVARLVIDSVSASPQSTGLTLLNEVLGSCPDAKRHPSDTLRDIEVLLAAGVDPNLSDMNGTTPLRKCIEHCPAVDLVARIRKLLDGGADPEAQGPDGVQPYVLAARTFEGPLLAEVMEALVSKIQGRHRRLVGDKSFTWDSNHFPIAEDQTYEQAMSCVRSTGDFRLKTQDMVPEDVHKTFTNAYFTVVSKNYLDTMTRVAKSRTLLPKEKDEIVWVLGMRTPINCPAYKFDQELVIALLDPLPIPNMDLEHTIDNATPDTAHAATPSSTSTRTHAPFQFNPNSALSATSPASQQPAPQIRDESLTDDFFIPEATSIRWKGPSSHHMPDDLEHLADAVLQFKCTTCGDDKMLTKAELAKHRVEHEHTASCVEEGCKRRFCARRGWMPA